MSAKGTPDILKNIPSYIFPEAAASALAKVTAYGDWRRRPSGTMPIFKDIRVDEARAVIERALARGGGWLTPVEIDELLSAAGIRSARTRFASSVEAAVAAAREIGFPVALKATGPALLHKTEVGGVALNLADEESVRSAYTAMAAPAR